MGSSQKENFACGLTACTPGSAPGPTLGNVIHLTCHNLTSSPLESEGMCFTGVGLSVCLSVTTITKEIVDGFVQNLWEGSWGKGKTKFAFCYDR